MRRAWAFAWSVVAVGAVVACTTDYQQGLDDPNYGGPNALSNQTPPGSTSDQPSGTSSGGGGSDPACVTKSKGTVVAQTTPCAVSFTTDIMAIFKAKTCTSAAGCHGTGNPPPLINDDVGATYQALTNFTPSTGKIYVNPCSIDPTMSAIASNLNLAAAAGDRGTVMPPGAGLAAGDLDKVTKWVACGAPKN